MPRRKQGKTAEPNTRTNGIDVLKDFAPGFWEKLESDKEIKPLLKDKFTAHLQQHESGSIKDHVEIFFRGNQQEGSPVTLTSDELLGSVRERDRTIDRIWEVTKIEKKSQVEDMVDDWVSLNPITLKKEIESWPNLDETPICDYLMWSYRNANNPKDPFFKIIIEDLPCRLGLPTFGKAHYALGHLLPKTKKVTKPTAFDGEL